MGKEQVYFRDTREKAETKRERREGQDEKNENRYKRTSNVKKNISKKDSYIKKRYKTAEREERYADKRKKREQNAALEKMQRGDRSMKERKQQILSGIKTRREANKQGDAAEGEDWEDVDEYEREVYQTTGYFDVPDAEATISKADQALLQQMENKNTAQIPQKQNSVAVLPPAGERTLADLIQYKLDTGDYQDGNNIDSKSITASGGLDPKVVAAYKKVGVVMRSYKSGKLPKAFKIIPQTQNWEELLMLTNPDSWSAHSSFEATKIFCSQLNSKMTQRFYNVILLPNVIHNIKRWKKLHYHLYMAVKKSMFKTGAFFKGFLIPLAETADTREAIIIGSILQKMSINALDVAAALVKMTTFEYKLGNGYFIKVLLSKRYTLPTIVLDALIDYFCKTGMQNTVPELDDEEQEMDDEEQQPINEDYDVQEMPVMWHQTVLALVQCYKAYFSVKQRKKIQTLIKVQNHHAITPEIKRELAHMDMSASRKLANENMS